MRRWMRRDEGQSSAEFTGMMVLIAMIIGAIVVANPAIPRTIADSLGTAICQITGGSDCGGPQVAGGGNPWDPGNDCVLSTVGGGAHFGVTVAFVEIGSGLYAMIEENADGTWDLTIIDEASVAASAGVGGSAGIQVGDFDLSGNLSAGVSATLLAELGTTYTYESLGDAQTALVFEAIEAGAGQLGPLPGWIAGGATSLATLIPGIDRPEPIAVSQSATVGLELGAGAAATLAGQGAELAASLGGEVGVNVNSDGTYSVAVGVNFDVEGGASQPQLGQISGALGTEVAMEYTFNEAGELITVSVIGQADLAGSAQLFGDDAGLGDVLSGTSAPNDSDRYVVQATVDVSGDPAAQQAFMDMAAGSAQVAGGNPASGAALIAGAAGTVADSLANDSQVGVLHYNDSVFPVEAWVSAGLLAEIGLSVGGEFSQSDLQSAAFYDREEGEWVPWTSCTGG